MKYTQLRNKIIREEEIRVGKARMGIVLILVSFLLLVI